MAKSFAVPTNDLEVRARLRSFGEPVTLFGEDKADRRERLRAIMVERYQSGLPVGDNIDLDGADGDEDEENANDEEEEFYTPGNFELLSARRDIYTTSRSAAQMRLRYTKLIASFPMSTHIAYRRRIISSLLSKIDLLGSQFVSERPASMVRFAPQGNALAVSSWAGEVKVFSVPNLNQVQTVGTIQLDSDKPAIAWGPNHDAALLAAGGTNGNMFLYNLTTALADGAAPSEEYKKPVAQFKGHEQRIGRVAFHPTGRYLGSASYDMTWRLWDVNTSQELLVQEGHAKEVFALKFHPDGSLCGTAGLDCVARLWDLRTGKGILSLVGHARPIYALDISPNGYHIATGGADGTIKIWDLRQQQQVFDIPAHTSVVSDIKFYAAQDTVPKAFSDAVKADRDSLPQIAEEDVKTQEQYLSPSGAFIVSSSYDRTLKIWNADTWTHVSTLQGHADKVMSADVVGNVGASNETYIASSGWDRTVKLWAKEEDIVL